MSEFHFETESSVRICSEEENESYVKFRKNESFLFALDNFLSDEYKFSFDLYNTLLMIPLFIKQKDIWARIIISNFYPSENKDLKKEFRSVCMRIDYLNRLKFCFLTPEKIIQHYMHLDNAGRVLS